MSNLASDDPAYDYRWANGDKLHDTASAGWALVQPLQERKVGTTEFGTPLYAYRYCILKAERTARTAKAAAASIDQVATNLAYSAQAAFREMWRSGQDSSPPSWHVDPTESAEN